MDDSEIVLDVTSALLEDAGFEVHTARSASDIQPQHGTAGPSLVLLDVYGVDGTEVDVDTVRRALRPARPSILLFSGMDDARLARMARDTGADGYVSKTIGPDALVEQLLALAATGRGTIPRGKNK